MPIILNKQHAKYKVNTAQDKGVTKLMSPTPTMSPMPTMSLFRTHVTMSPVDSAK